MFCKGVKAAFANILVCSTRVSIFVSVSTKKEPQQSRVQIHGFRGNLAFYVVGGPGGRRSGLYGHSVVCITVLGFYGFYPNPESVS